jgi:drug/metabolite transporter (DMT)-like permease
MKARDPLSSLDPGGGPVVTPRSIVALLLIVIGIAWIVYYYVGVRPGPHDLDPKTFEPIYSGISFFGDLKKWNYVIGFGAILVGLVVAAHPSTPLGRGRGVVVGMLGCFLIGLLWICTYYVFSNNLTKVPVFNDLGQYNLMVGIAFMAVGFTYATRWE